MAFSVVIMVLACPIKMPVDLLNFATVMYYFVDQYSYHYL